MRVRGGKPFYGQAIGILTFDGKHFPMIPGDVANATSYQYPVRIKVVPGLEDNPYPPIQETDGQFKPEVLSLNEAAQELESDGVRAIVLACGFFSLVQKAIADAVNIPVFASPLLIIPQILIMLKSSQKLCVLTASQRLLSADFFHAVGVKDMSRIALVGLDQSEEFNMTHMGGPSIEMDVAQLREDVLTVAQGAVAADTDIGAILIECSNLPCYSADVQEATGLPVFDYIMCVDMLFRAVVQRRFDGYL